MKYFKNMTRWKFWYTLDFLCIWWGCVLLGVHFNSWVVSVAVALIAFSLQRSPMEYNLFNKPTVVVEVKQRVSMPTPNFNMPKDVC